MRRSRPDYERIRALELECGLREPNLIEQFYDPDLTTTVSRRPTGIGSMCPCGGDYCPGCRRGLSRRNR